MEQQVEKLFGEAVLREAADRFGLRQSHFIKLGDFENYVYELKNHQGESVILRLTHSSHRSEEQVAAELNWIYFLMKEGLDIPGCSESLRGRLTEKIAVERDGSYFTAAVFQKAGGKQPDFNRPEEWNPQLFREWGCLTGRIHRATCRYRVPDSEHKRPHWHEDELLLQAHLYVNEGDEYVLEELEEVTRHLHGLRQDDLGYGLIHTDMHPRNFFVDNGRIRLFDFDDSAYNWFIHDIAIPLYYSLSWSVPAAYGGDKHAFAVDFITAFWQGYRQEYALDDQWLLELPYFLRLRDITLYLVINKKVDAHMMDDRTRKWMGDIQNRLKLGVPIVELDYLSLLQKYT